MIIEYRTDVSTPVEKHSKNWDDKTGRKYGKLTVLGYSHSNRYSTDKKKSNSRSFWKCRCDCGKEVIVVSYNLSSGTAKSCGCRRSETALKKFNYKEAELGATGQVYCSYRTQARARGYEFLLTKEEFSNIFRKECNYCGSIGLSNHKYRRNNFPYTGIDRIDNTRGYTLDNSVPCCKFCNSMKNVLSAEDFLSHIKKIFLHQKLTI